MLTVPPGEAIYRTLGIDPGTDTVGVGVVDIDMVTGETWAMWATTLRGGRLARIQQQMAQQHSDLVTRLCVLRSTLTTLFYRWQPNSFMIEDSFIGPNPKTGMILAQAVAMTRDAIMAYDPTKVIELIKPSTAKKIAGAKGTDKSATVSGLREHPYCQLHPTLYLDQLSDHATDALAIALVKAHWIRQDFGLPTHSRS